MIYWCMFLTSCMFLYLSDRSKGIKRSFFAFVGLLLPVLLATVRAESVGIDVRVYVKPLYLCALSTENIKNFYLLKSVMTSIRDVEWGYALLTFFTTKICKGLWGILFASEFITVYAIYASFKEYNFYEMKRYENGMDKNGISYKIPVWLGMFCFYGLFYNNSLNQIRQTIAVSMVIWAFMCMLSGRWIRTIIIMVLASGFHTSAIFAVVLYIIYFFIRKKNKLIVGLITLFTVIFGLFSNQIFTLVIKYMRPLVAIISERYASQAYGLVNSNYNNDNMNYSWVMLSIVMVCIAALLWKKNKQDMLNQFFLFVSIAFLCMLPFVARYDIFGRLAWYFMFWVIFILPLFHKVVKGWISPPVFVGNIVNIAVPTVYWIVVYGLFDFTGTIPYLFMWQ